MNELMTLGDVNGRVVEVGNQQNWINVPFDAKEKNLVAIVQDASESMQRANSWSSIKKGLCGLRNYLCEDIEVRAKTEIIYERYGTHVDEQDCFVPVEYWEPGKLDDVNMGLTDTAAALESAFDKLRERIHFYHTDVFRGVYPPIVLLITDGLYTSDKSDMDRVIGKYDSYIKSSGARRIRIWGVTPNKNAVAQLKGFCDLTFLVEDYEAIADAILNYAKVESCISQSTIACDPITGDEILTSCDDIDIEGRISQIIPRFTLDGSLISDNQTV